MPPLVVSIGEPGGIGPECIAKAWQALRGELSFAVIGDPAHLSGVPIHPIRELAEAPMAMQSALPVLARDFGAPRLPGQYQAAHAAPIINAIEEAVRLAQSGAASGVVTLPISKAALAHGAGFTHPGHTEFLAALDGNATPVMMIASPALRVVPVTIHIQLAEVPTALTPELLETTIRITHAAMIRDFGLSQPRLAIAGLNPHAGEEGRMGHEDRDVIAPVIARLQAEGMAVSGPFPADTMFHAGARQHYDAALAMYHDQALIPAKTLDFDNGVNCTLGLSFVRCSPDHGTALDIAGKDLANPASTIAALRLAHDMAKRRAP